MVQFYGAALASGRWSLLAKGKLSLPGSIHIQSHRLSNSFGELFRVFWLAAVEGAVICSEAELLVRSEVGHWHLSLLSSTFLALWCRDTGCTTRIYNVHQDITVHQRSLLLCRAALLHRSWHLGPSVFSVCTFVNTLVSFGLHAWII